MTEVASRFGVSRQALHAWLGKYEADGLEGLADRSRRPASVLVPSESAQFWAGEVLAYASGHGPSSGSAHESRDHALPRRRGAGDVRVAGIDATPGDLPRVDVERGASGTTCPHVDH